MEIIEFQLNGKEGIWLRFDRKIALNHRLPSDNWWLSWEKLSELITIALKQKGVINEK